MQDYNKLVKVMFWEILQEDFSEDIIQWMYDSVKHVTFNEDMYNEIYQLLTGVFIDLATIVDLHPERESIIREATFVDIIALFMDESTSEWLIFDTIQELNKSE